MSSPAVGSSAEDESSARLDRVRRGHERRFAPRLCTPARAYAKREQLVLFIVAQTVNTETGHQLQISSIYSVSRKRYVPSFGSDLVFCLQAAAVGTTLHLQPRVQL